MGKGDNRNSPKMRKLKRWRKKKARQLRKTGGKKQAVPQKAKSAQTAKSE